MEEETLYDRIGETDFNPTYVDGQTFQHTDVNKIVSITKEGVNENYYDIQRMQNGTKSVGNAMQIDGATLSRYIDEPLQANDNKVPSSQQTKEYIDGLFAEYSAPVRGVDYWTEDDKQEIIDETSEGVEAEMDGILEDYAKLTDIPSDISSFNNDRGYLVEDNMQMVDTLDVENRSQITDATGYAELNKIYGDLSQNGTPTPSNSIDIDIVTGDININVSNSDDTESQEFDLSLGNIELCKIGNYKDYIYYENGKWYIHKEIGKLVLNGSESGYYTSGNAIKIKLNDAGLENISNLYQYNSMDNIAYCNYFTQAIPQTLYTSSSSRVYVGFGIASSGASSDGLFFANNGIALADFKTWLESNNIEIYYVLGTPTTIEIVNTELLYQLNKIINLSLYENETNFLITSDNKSPVLNITYSITNREFYSKNEVNNIVEKAAKKITNNVEFIFPKNFENAYSGDCNIIRYNNQVIMIDTYSSAQYNDIVDMLRENNITHIDYLILTHYHSDHIGNFESLVNNGYINNKTNLYFPAEVENWENYSDKPAYYQNYCEENNLVYYVPNENETLKINDLKLTFFNCDATTLDELYYDNSTIKNYNNCSTVVKLEYRDTQVFYSADILSEGMQRIYDSKFIKGRLDLYKIEHHGIEPTANKNFIIETAPVFAYQPSGILDYQKKVLFARCEIGKFLDEVGCKNYIMFQQADYVKFISDGSTLSCVSGVSGSIANRTNEITYYVDKSATQGSICDGSQTHPFTEINQAFCAIKNNPCETVIINLADGDYGVPELEFRRRAYVDVGSETRLIINGNEIDDSAVTINGLYVNSSNIELNHLTIDIDNYDGVNAYNSKVKLNNVVVTSLTGTTSNYSCILARQHCELCMNNTTIDYGNEGIIATDSIVTLQNILVGEHISSNVFNINRSNVVSTNNITYSNYADKLSNNNNYYTVQTPQLLFVGNEYSEVTLPKTIEGFHWIEIMYQDDGSTNIKSTGKIYYPNNKAIYLDNPIVGADGTIYYNSARAGVVDNKITLTRNRQIVFHADGTKTLRDEGNYIRIIRVIGGFYDVVDYRS